MSFQPLGTEGDQTTGDIPDASDVYLPSHYLNQPSQVYAYAFWGIVLLFILFRKIPLHLSFVRRWTVRKARLDGRRRVGDKSTIRPPAFLPSNGNLLFLGSLLILLCLLFLVGPDCIPGPTFKLADNVTLPTQHPMITKSLWTSAARAGLLAFCLLPLCVLFALKSSPSAIFTWKWTAGLYFDKLAVAHKWTAVFLYFFTCLHVLLWTVKLCRDRVGPNGELAIVLAFQTDRFVCGCIAFVIFTLLMASSIPSMRKAQYEAFYALHVLLFPLMLIMSALHHPETAWWAWVALGLWLFERIWRSGRIFWLNYYTTNNTSRGSSRTSSSSSSSASQKRQQQQQPSEKMANDRSPLNLTYATTTPELKSSNLLRRPAAPKYRPPPGYAHAELLSGATIRLTYTPAQAHPADAVRWAPGQHFLLNIPALSKFTSHPFTCCTVIRGDRDSREGSSDWDKSPQDSRQMIFLIRAKKGWTKDLWDAVAHAITGSSVDSGDVTGDLPTMRGGETKLSESSFGKSRFPAVTTSTTPQQPASSPPSGLLMRMNIDGPFGSSIGVPWERHSSVLIVVGGSGVTFGLAVLQHLCGILASLPRHTPDRNCGSEGLNLEAEDSEAGQGAVNAGKLRRVRFVWLVREFGHIHWCASIIRRCKMMLPEDVLRIDIFVTKTEAITTTPLETDGLFNERDDSAGQVSPMTPTPLRPGRPLPPSPDTPTTSTGINEKHRRDASLTSLGYYSTESLGATEGHGVGQHHQHRPHPSSGESTDGVMTSAYPLRTRDLTEFEGDSDIVLPGEISLSHRIKREGRVRRANTRLKARNSRVVSTLLDSLDVSRPQSPLRFEAFDTGARVAEVDGDGALETPRRLRPNRRVDWEGGGEGPRDYAQSGSRRPMVDRLSGTRNTLSGSSIGFDRPDHEEAEAEAEGGRAAAAAAAAANRRDQILSARHSRATSQEVAWIPLHCAQPTPPRAFAESVVYVDDDDADLPLEPEGGDSTTSGRLEEVGQQHLQQQQQVVPVQLRLDEQDLRDISVVAENTVPGKPKLARIMEYEIQDAVESLLVTCCGPESLDALVRETVAAKMGQEARKEDGKRIEYYAEEFNY